MSITTDAPHAKDELTTTTQLTDFLIYSEWEKLHNFNGRCHQNGFIADGL